jgi:Membrane-fusion protein
MMVQLILSVEDPFRLRPTVPGEWISLDNKEKKPFPAGKKTAEGQAYKKKRVAFHVPLFIGAFVDVKIPGRILESVIELPVRAIRDENTVWVVENGLLQIRKVEIAHMEGDNFYVSNGLKHGEEVVTSPLKGAADGMKVSLQGSGTPGRSVKTQGRNGEQKQGTGRGMNKQKSGKLEWQKPTTSKVPAGGGEEAKRQRPRNQNKPEQEDS